MTTCIPAGTGKLHFRVRDFNAQGCRKASWVTFSELSWSCGVSKFLQIQRCNSSQSPINESSKPLRTITSSSLRDGSTKFFDFSVIGSGVAGLRYALEVAKHGSVAVITKAEPHESNTNYAQGGVGAVLCPSDSVESHVQDTIVAGAYLCDEETVRVCYRTNCKQDWWIWYGSQKQSKGERDQNRRFQDLKVLDAKPLLKEALQAEGKQKDVLKAAGALFSHICEV